MKRTFLVIGIVIGALLTLGPLWGLLGTVFGMNRAYTVLSSSNGVSDPNALSGAIGTTLMATAFGLFACPVGLVLLALCIVLLVRSKERQQPPSIPSGPAPSSS